MTQAFKTYIHERPFDGCQFGWAERDTMQPHEVRHECRQMSWHAEHGQPHVCMCGLVEKVRDDEIVKPG